MMDTFSIKERPEYEQEEKREMPYKCHAEYVRKAQDDLDAWNRRVREEES